MITIILRRKILASKEYPIILKITKKGKSKIISLGISCLLEHWNGYELTKKHPNYIVKNRIILKKKEEALKIIDDFNLRGEDFTLNQFEEKFRGKKMKHISVHEFWTDRVKDLSDSGRMGTARSNKDTERSFFRFCNKRVTFKEITPILLDKYVTFLRQNGNTNGGIGVKLRTIRALYNDAMNKGIIEEASYPFKVFKVSKFKSKGIKKALTRGDINKIENLDTVRYPHLLDARNYFMFSYYTRGMNFVDMMKLKWEWIQDGKIYYLRSKTKMPFVVEILDPIKDILKYYKSQNRATSFVFPLLLKDDLNPSQIENRKAKTLKTYNRNLKGIAEILSIEGSITSYTARHSFATNLKFAGISTDIISQSLGHSNLNVTQSYLKEFENDTVDEAVKKLLNEPLPVY